MPRAAVLGSPVAHSLSPALHRAAYAALGLSGWAYDAVECAEEGLAPFLDGLGPEWAGLSLTMPLKRVAIGLMATVSALARDVGAANTVLLSPDGRHADNTDVGGLVDALSGADASAAVVLGAGGTAAAALAALRDLGASGATVVVRDRGRARDLLAAADRLGFRDADGRCVIDDYVSRVGSHPYREIACIVTGRRHTSILVAAALKPDWHTVAPVLERAASTFLER